MCLNISFLCGNLLDYKHFQAELVSLSYKNLILNIAQITHKTNKGILWKGILFKYPIEIIILALQIMQERSINFHFYFKEVKKQKLCISSSETTNSLYIFSEINIKRSHH